MTEIWNMWDVKHPPVCCVKTSLNLKGITSLNEVTYDALKTVRDLLHFDREAAVLSRFLYKRRRVFRHDKGMKYLAKVNQCLKKYLKLDLSGVLFTFKQSLPPKFDRGTTYAHLPTRQMLKFVLLRLQAFSRLFARMIDLCTCAGAYTYQKLCLGWALNNTFLVFCITARILATSKFLVAKSIEWYSSFSKCLPLLEETAEFLPGYNFPVDLKAWLGDVDVSPLKKKTFVDDIFEFIDLVKEEEKEENEDDEVKIVSEKFLRKFFKPEDVVIDSDVEEIKEPEEEKKGTKRPFRSFEMDEDLGVPIADNDGEEFERTSKRIKKKGGRRIKWLKKVKKTLRKCEGRGSHVLARNSSADCKDFLQID